MAWQHGNDHTAASARKLAPWVQARDSAEQEAVPAGNVAPVQLGLGVQHHVGGALRYSLPPSMSLQELQAKGNACKNLNIF